MNTAIDFKFKRHRAQVSSADSTPVTTEAYADLSAATLAKFQKIDGATPVLLLKWGGTGAKTATIRTFYIDEITDFSDANKKSNILTWGLSSNITSDYTRIALSCAVGSKIFVSVSSISADTTLDMFIADDTNNG